MIDDIFGHTLYFYAVYLNINWETPSVIPPMTKHQGVICNTAAAIRGNISYMQRISPLFCHTSTQRDLGFISETILMIFWNKILSYLSKLRACLFEECVTLSKAVEGIMWQEGISRQRGRWDRNKISFEIEKETMSWWKSSFTLCILVFLVSYSQFTASIALLEVEEGKLLKFLCFYF